MNCCLDNYVKQCTTLRVIFLKRSPGQLEPKKLTNQHFYKKTLIKKNQSFKIQISNSSSVLPIDVEKNEIYTNNCLGSMLVSYYVSQHARLATAASTIPSGFWEAGSLGTSYERMRAGCKLYSTLKIILFYGKKGLLGFPGCHVGSDMDQACFWVCSSPESNGVEILLNWGLDNYNITCDPLLKKIPRPVWAQKVDKSTLLQKDFKQEKTILQNSDFQLFQRSSHWCGKKEIYTNNCLGSMLVSCYVSQHPWKFGFPYLIFPPTMLFTEDKLLDLKRLWLPHPVVALSFPQWICLVSAEDIVSWWTWRSFVGMFHVSGLCQWCVCIWKTNYIQ